MKDTTTQPLVLKIGHMSNAQEFTARRSGSAILMQSESYIAEFDAVTGVGVLSAGAFGPVYQHYLLKNYGARDLTVNPEDLKTIQDFIGNK